MRIQQIHVLALIKTVLDSIRLMLPERLVRFLIHFHTTADAVFLQNYLLNAATLTADQQQTADLNADGTVNGFDLALLRQKLA